MFVVIMLNKSFDNPHQKHPFHSQILSGLFDESSRWLVGGFSFETKLFKGGGGGGGGGGGSATQEEVEKT